MKTHTLLGGDNLDLGLLSGHLLGYLDETWHWIEEQGKPPSNKDIEEKISFDCKRIDPNSHQFELLRTVLRDIGHRKDSGGRGWRDAFRVSCVRYLDAHVRGKKAILARALGIDAATLGRSVKDIRSINKDNLLKRLEDLCDIEGLRLSIRSRPKNLEMISDQIITEVPYSWARFSLAIRRAFSLTEENGNLEDLERLMSLSQRRESVDDVWKWLAPKMLKDAINTSVENNVLTPEISGSWVSTAYQLGMFESWGFVLKLVSNIGKFERAERIKSPQECPASFPNPLEAFKGGDIPADLSVQDVIALVKNKAKAIQSRWPYAAGWIGGSRPVNGQLVRVTLEGKKPAPLADFNANDRRNYTPQEEKNFLLPQIPPNPQKSSSSERGGDGVALLDASRSLSYVAAIGQWEGGAASLAWKNPVSYKSSD